MTRYAYIADFAGRICAEYSCQIMIKDFVGFTARDPAVASLLTPYRVHKSPFCVYMKGRAGLWDDCQLASRRLIERSAIGAGSPFCGLCYAGYGEIVIPVMWNDRAVACICVGGLDIDPEKSRERIKKVCERKGLDDKRATTLFEQSVCRASSDIKKLTSLVGVLADFLSMYYQALVNSGAIDPAEPYIADVARLSTLTNVLEYIHLNLDQDVRLIQIARFCGCSESYISHLFKRNMKKSVSEYVNCARVEKARSLLALEADCLRDIAQKCGFGDPNYFSTVFKRHTGLTPSEYRRERRKGDDKP